MKYIYVIGLVFQFIFLGYSLTKNIIKSIWLSPILFLFYSGISSIIFLFFEFDLWKIVLTTLSITNLTLLAIWFRQTKRNSDHVKYQLIDRSQMQILAFAIVCFYILISSLPAPVAWDSRSIWFFHASWFNNGSDIYLQAQGNPSVAWSHPNYPSFVPAAIATTWGILNSGENFWIAQTVISIFTVSFLAFIFDVIFNEIDTKKNSSGEKLSGILAFFILSIYITFHPQTNNGYMDNLQALTSFAILIFLMKNSSNLRKLRDFKIFLIIAICSTQIKSEGMLLYLILIFSILFRESKNQIFYKKLTLLLIPLIFNLLWQLKLAQFGQSESLFKNWSFRLADILNANSDTRNSLEATIDFSYSVGFTRLALVSLVGLLLVKNFSKAKSDEVEILILTIALFLLFILLTYTVGDYGAGIYAWLEQSFSRFTMTPKLIMLYAIIRSIFILNFKTGKKFT